MIEIPSVLEGKQFDLYKLEQTLKPEGYSIGGNWEYDHGSFDYKINDRNGYQFLRLPFFATNGQLDCPNCTVKLGIPFLLSHVYQQGLDDFARANNTSAPFNQFQEPADKDGNIPGNILEIGKKLVQKLESILLDEH